MESAPPTTSDPTGDLPSRDPAPPRFGDGAYVALVIDDLGRDLRILDSLASLGVDLTYSVLPFEPLTDQVVSVLRKRRAEILCHLPMEAKNGANPGPGALTSNMTSKVLAEATRSALAAVPGAVGVNNHMGSRLSEAASAMRPVLEVVDRHGLFYLDSRTSAGSVGYSVAMELGVPALERHVFLDRNPRPEAIQGQFSRLLELARQRGAAVAIGHPYRETVETLRTEVPRAQEAGYRFVTVSTLVHRRGAPPP